LLSLIQESFFAPPATFILRREAGLAVKAL